MLHTVVVFLLVVVECSSSFVVNMRNPLKQLFHKGDATTSQPNYPATATGAAVPNSPQDGTDDAVLDVVIIGAGWAGLGAARYLLDKQQQKGTPMSMCILEGHATDIGGRSRTQILGPEDGGSMVELGSQWIHGIDAKKNQVYQLALEHDMMVHYDGLKDAKSTAVWCDRPKNGERIVARLDPQQIAQLEQQLLQGKEGFLEFLNTFPRLQKKLWKAGMLPPDENHSSKKRPPAVSVQHVIQEYARVLNENPRTNLSPQKKQFLQYLVHMDLTHDYAGSLEDIDACWYDHDLEYGCGDLHFGTLAEQVDRGSNAGGYSALIQEYAAPLVQRNAVRCNCLVTSVQYSSDEIVIEYQQQGSQHRIKARAVVCTVPLGVLKAERIQFHPKLPDPKQQAIQRLGMGTYNKVVLLWNPEQRGSLPWLFSLEEQKKQGGSTKERGKATSCMWMERVKLPGEPQGPWTVCYNAHTHHSANCPVALYFFLAGREAQQVEGLSDEETQQQAMAALQEWFDCPDIPSPNRIIVTRWNQDPLTLGSYSFYQVGSSPADRQELAKPILNKVFFAGEATHVEYYATTHGALMSGQDAAKALWKGRKQRQKKKKR